MNPLPGVLFVCIELHAESDVTLRASSPSARRRTHGVRAGSADSVLTAAMGQGDSMALMCRFFPGSDRSRWIPAGRMIRCRAEGSAMALGLDVYREAS